MSDITAISTGALPIATDAIRNALTNVAKDANVVANSQSVTSAETLQALVDARQQVIYTKAGATVLSTTDRMVRSLLDTRA